MKQFPLEPECNFRKKILRHSYFQLRRSVSTADTSFVNTHCHCWLAGREQVSNQWQGGRIWWSMTCKLYRTTWAPRCSVVTSNKYAVHSCLSAPLLPTRPLIHSPTHTHTSTAYTRIQWVPVNAAQRVLRLWMEQLKVCSIKKQSRIAESGWSNCSRVQQWIIASSL